MKYDYDCIVIGGGPAGSTFARYAANGGMNVLVIDKRKELGVPVRCGEGLSKMEVHGRIPEEMPKHCIAEHITGAKVYAPNGKDIVWQDESTKGWVLERKFFDKWLCELAVEKGVKVKSYTRATEFLKEDGKINGVKVSHGNDEIYEVRAPLVVSAEGMESMMARQAGFNTVHQLYDVGTCYQYEMKPIEHESMIELYFGTVVAPRGYVWVFPKADKRANVGIGIGGHLTDGTKNGGIKGAAPKYYLDRFIKNQERFKDASTLMDFGGVISVGAPINEFVKDNVMVIGTAAKQVDPIHGGGIYLAIESGKIAAGAALNAFEKKDFKKENMIDYEKIWADGEGKKCGKRLLLRKVLEKLDDEDLDHIINNITAKDLSEVMQGRFASPVAKVLAGRPQLMKVMSALIS